MPLRDFRLASEDDEDALDREGQQHGAPSVMLMIGLHPQQGHGFDPRLADESKRSDGADLPDMSKKELDQRITCCELELACLTALRDGDRQQALRLNRQLGAADKKLAKLMSRQSGNDSDE